MNITLNKYKEIIKDLHNKGVGLLELEIWDEIDCQLNDRILSDSQNVFRRNYRLSNSN